MAQTEAVDMPTLWTGDVAMSDTDLNDDEPRGFTEAEWLEIIAENERWAKAWHDQQSAVQEFEKVSK